VIGLLEVSIAFTAVSFGGYFAIHELKEKDVKRIQKKRLDEVRKHLSELAKKCAEAKEITEEMENDFLELSQNEYESTKEPSRILSYIDYSFLFSGILFLGTMLADWANSNSEFLLLGGVSLFPLEFEMFFVGIFLLAIGLLSLERLRRITAKESDIDPAPFGVILMIGIFLAMDIYFLWITISNYSSLTPFGKTLHYSSWFPLVGAVISVTTWEKGGWKRLLGMILLLAPFFLIFGWLILSFLGIL
jgi:hypothetical protein